MSPLTSIFNFAVAIAIGVFKYYAIRYYLQAVLHEGLVYIIGISVASITVCCWFTVFSLIDIMAHLDRKDREDKC